MDERIKILARNLVNNSVKAKKGDKILIHHTGPSTKDLARALVKEAYKAGAVPFIKYTDPEMEREMLLECSEDQLKIMVPQGVLPVITEGGTEKFFFFPNIGEFQL